MTTQTYSDSAITSNVASAMSSIAMYQNASLQANQKTLAVGMLVNEQTQKDVEAQAATAKTLQTISTCLTILSILLLPLSAVGAVAAEASTAVATAVRTVAAVGETATYGFNAALCGLQAYETIHLGSVQKDLSLNQNYSHSLTEAAQGTTGVIRKTSQNSSSIGAHLNQSISNELNAKTTNIRK